MSRLTPGFVALRDVGNGNDAGMRFKSLSKTPYTQARHLLPARPHSSFGSLPRGNAQVEEAEVNAHAIPKG